MGFAGAVVAPFGDILSLPKVNAAQTLALGELVADQAVGVLVDAALAEVVGLGEAHVGVKGISDLAVAGELLAVVGCDRRHAVFDAPERADEGVPQELSSSSQRREIRHSVNRADNDTAVADTD